MYEFKLVRNKLIDSHTHAQFLTLKYFYNLSTNNNIPLSNQHVRGGMEGLGDKHKTNLLLNSKAELIVLSAPLIRIMRYTVL